jgi:Protein of unknown function (DUF3667)
VTTCLNCGKLFKGNFCPNCGQEAKEQRLSATVLLYEAVHFVSHFEKGFLHTAWAFLVQPGQAGINFLAGKRRQYQKPVSYFLVLTGLYILVHNYIIYHFHYHYYISRESVAALDFKEQSNILLRTHFTPFIILIILLSSVVIYFILGRNKYNFIEILTISLYGGGTYFLMLFLSDLILGVLMGINVISMNVFLWQISISSLYNLWFCFDFFKRARLTFFPVRLLTTSLLVSGIGWIIMNYLPMIWASLNK